MLNLGGKILDHYQQFLGNYIDAKTHTDSKRNIQLLGFNKVFENCLTFATLGVSNYSEIIDTRCEVILAVDDDYDNCSIIFINALFYVIQEKIKFGRATIIEGMDQISEGFSKVHNKSALYFTETYILPENFSKINNSCKMYMAIFISSKEVEYIREYGCEQFEELLEKSDCDIIDINRKSIV